MTKQPKRLCQLLFSLTPALMLAASTGSAENWPGWRGPRGDGTSQEAVVPTDWAPDRNVDWKVAVPGVGHASPIIWEDHLFLATCLEDRQERVLVAFDRRDGGIRWQKVVLKSPLEEKHQLNSFASSTPATDGKYIYCTFLDGEEMAVAAFDYSGHQQWLVRPGKFSSKHGFCSSPVLFEDLVIVNGDHDGDAFLVALDKQSGTTRWKIPRHNKTRSYVTPIVREIDGRTQLILSGNRCVASYDPRTGDQHWIIDGPTEQFVASMVFNGDLLFMTAGFPDLHMLAIRPTGHGNVTDSHIAWRTTRGASYVPSPIAAGDYFLVVSDGGVASCFEASTGERLWMQRIGTHFSASLVSAGGLVYFLADDGTMTIVEPGPKFKVVSKNSLDQPCYASPAISRGQIFIRGEKHLFAIGKSQSRVAQDR